MDRMKALNEDSGVREAVDNSMYTRYISKDPGEYQVGQDYAVRR